MSLRRFAALGVVLALAVIGWAQLTGALHGGHAGSYSLRVAAVVVAWLVGAAVTARLGRTGAAFVAIGVIVAVAALFAFTPGSLSGRALAPPLRYGNADGAFATAAVAAGGLLMTLSVARPLRVAGGVAGVGFLVVCHQTESSAAEVMGVVVLLACLAAALGRPGLRKALAIAAPVVVVLAALFTVVVGVSFRSGAHTAQPLIVRAADHGLSERRSQLWHDATVIVRDNPATGVGPGGFATTSPTARHDVDARWAHSAWLQQASDQGAIGLVLFAGAIGVGWAALLSGRRDAVAVAGSWALGALLTQASIDYVLDFVAVPIVVALLAGAATALAARQRVTTRNLAAPRASAGSLG